MTQGIIVGILFMGALLYMARKFFFKSGSTEATCEKCATPTNLAKDKT